MKKIWQPDSERYHQRPKRLVAEGCGFYPRAFEELADAASAYVEF